MLEGGQRGEAVKQFKGKENEWGDNGKIQRKGLKGLVVWLKSLHCVAEEVLYQWVTFQKSAISW